MTNRVEVTNDIDSKLVVQIIENEGPDNYYKEEAYDYEVVINDCLYFYFNVAKDFHDWLDKLNSTFGKRKERI